MTTKQIITELKNGAKFGNQNTLFVFTSEGEMIMFEWAKEGKCTKYYSIEKFARRVLRFYKIGY